MLFIIGLVLGYFLRPYIQDEVNSLEIKIKGKCNSNSKEQK